MGTMDRATAGAIIDEIKAALTPIGKRHRLKLAKNTARYDAAMIRLTLELECLDASGENVAERANWDRCCRFFGLSSSDYGAVIPALDGGRDFKLVGIEPKRSKYPFTVEEVGTRKRYKLTETAVKMGLEQAKARQA